MKLKKYVVLLIVIGFIVGTNKLLSGEQENEKQKSFHTTAELDFFKDKLRSPIGPGEYFLNSTHCLGCHGYDSAQVANIDEEGNSVNLYDRWESTMMANSARDPLWRAKVSHEILVNPGHATALQDKCMSCHAPMGKYNSYFHGQAHFGLAELATDTLGLDGVSCTSCHTIDSTVGQTFSGIIPYDTSRTIYGPFQNPFVGPMQLYEGYTPTFSAHMDQAKLCSSCHTLITESVDTMGNFTGGEFVEQATYHEYLNSKFPAENITCQTCHMPRLLDPIIIANGFLALTPRYPFNQHTFVGANSFMLTMIKNNKTSLGSTVEDWKFDSTIAATNRLLRDSTIDFTLRSDSLTNDTGYFALRILNKAGHKFPSGYPSRRVVIQFLVMNATGDTIFQSGTFTNDQHVVGESVSFEPHHDVINQSGNPLIYELAMGDVHGNFTSVLERAAIVLKDNRIPPQGFLTSSPVYDTVVISNDALADPNFNFENSTQGSGTDIVHYHVPLTGVTGNIRVHARVFYQAVPPKWVEEMFMYNSPEIDTFRNMFNNADQTPLLIASDSIINITMQTNANRVNENSLVVYPTVSNDGKVYVKTFNGDFIRDIDVYSSDGKRIGHHNYSGNTVSCVLSLPTVKTVYLMKIQTTAGTFYRRTIRQ